jgi:hypothetical protein
MLVELTTGWIGVIAGWDLTRYDPDRLIDGFMMLPYYFVLLDLSSMISKQYKTAYLPQVTFQPFRFVSHN